MKRYWRGFALDRKFYIVPFRDDSSDRVAALERSDNVASLTATQRGLTVGHAFAALKRGYSLGCGPPCCIAIFPD